MITEFVAAMKAIPRIVDALEGLMDVGTAMAALIAAARARREQRLLDSEAERLLRDSGEESAGDGRRDSNG